MRLTDRVFTACSGLVLIAGSLIFGWGGRRHPPTGTGLGPIGSDEYFHNFARHIAGHADWIGIHDAILAGPLLWVLGATGACWLLAARGEKRVTAISLVALILGAAAWTVAFVADGFVAPSLARAVVLADGAHLASAISALRHSQTLVLRLGLVAWLLLGIGIAALGAGTIAGRLGGRAVGTGVGSFGIALGLWPLAAYALGVFDPGVFTSPWWLPTATTTLLWFGVLGGLLVAVAAGRAGLAQADVGVGAEARSIDIRVR